MWNTSWAEWMEWYIFDDHDKEGKFDAQCFFLLLRTSDEGSGNVGSHDL